MVQGIVWGLLTIVGPVVLFFSMVCAGIVFHRRSPAANLGSPDATGSLYRKAQHEHDVDQSIIDSPPLVPLPIRDQTRIR
jgi:hypothetical protein